MDDEKQMTSADYEEKHDESQREEQLKDPAPETALPEIWSEADFSQTVSKIRTGTWDEAKQNIIRLRDEIRRRNTDYEDMKARYESLKAENARLISEFAAQDLIPQDETVTELDKEIAEVEDIDSLWITG